MATPSRVGLNKARHKSGLYSKQREETKEREREIKEKEKPITEEEHRERLEKLKELGLVK